MTILLSGTLLVVLDQAEHDLALVTGELSVRDIGRRVAQPLDDHLAGRRGGDPAEVLRGVVPLADQLAVGVEFAGEDDDVTGRAVDLHPGVGGGRLVVVPVGRRQSGLDRVDERVEGDVLLALDAAQGSKIELHDRTSAAAVAAGPLNSTCTTARLTSP